MENWQRAKLVSDFVDFFNVPNENNHKIVTEIATEQYSVSSKSNITNENDSATQEQSSTTDHEKKHSNNLLYSFIAVLFIIIGFLVYAFLPDSSAEKGSVLVSDTYLEEESVPVSTYNHEEQETVQEAHLINEEQSAIIEFLTSIYTSEVGLEDIFSDEWVYLHCTKRMQKILRDKYDYDGEGWGSWIIGGWESGEDIETNVSSISFEEGFYSVTFIPGDRSKDYIIGKRQIRFSISLVNNIPVIDECQWVSDFTHKADDVPSVATSYRLEGLVNEKYEVVLELTQSGDNLFGRYYYKSSMRKYGDKESTYIKLSGSIDTDGNFNMEGSFYNSSKIEIWKGYITDNKLYAECDNNDGTTFVMKAHSY